MPFVGEDPSVGCWRHVFQPAAQGMDGEIEARVSRMVAFGTAREASGGRGKGLDWVDVLGPFPENPQLCFTKGNTVSAKCLLFAPFLSQRNSC